MGLYQSDWSKKPPHTHAYRAVTDVVQGHYHLIEGFSQPENGSNTDEHTHFYSGITSLKTAISIGITAFPALPFRGLTEHIIMSLQRPPLPLTMSRFRSATAGSFTIRGSKTGKHTTTSSKEKRERLSATSRSGGN